MRALAFPAVHQVGREELSVVELGTLSNAVASFLQPQPELWRGSG